MKAGELVVLGRPLGLSLGDRLCLATALIHQAEVLTADAAWSQLDHVPGLRVRNMRVP